MRVSSSALLDLIRRKPIWVGLLGFLVLLLLPPIAGLSRAQQSLAAVTLLMAMLWITQTLPIAVTSLIPLALFPLLGIEPAANVSKAYIDRNIFLFLGGFIIAMGIEKWGLHQRIALHIVRVLGTTPKRMVLGFMLATAFLSMWISNTASTLLMLPIGLALLKSLSTLPLDDKTLTPAEREQLEQSRQRALNQFITVLLLGIAYSASLGGMTTLVGTPTNLTFIGIWDADYPVAPKISAGQWMFAAIPLGGIYLLATWWYLTWRLPVIPGSENLDRGFFTKRIHQLGPPTKAEWWMLAIFFSTAMLWMFGKPLKFGETTLLTGWHAWAEDVFGAKGLHDSTVAMGMAILLFLVPARVNEQGETEALMDWNTAKTLPWGILLLIGGGFALAGAFMSTGLSLYLGEQFSHLVANWPIWLLVAATCFLLTFLTELTSNVATVATLVPVLAQTAVALGLDPRLVMIPATLAASCAFMLPIATPPNAIVFGSNRIEMGHMMRYGIVLNLLGVILITAAMFLLFVPQFGISLDGLPDWVPSAKP